MSARATATWTVALAAATGVTLVSAVQLYIADLLGGRSRNLIELVGRQGLASLAWLLAAVGVVWLARRVPVRRERALRTLAIHGVAILAVAAAVNILIPALWGLAGLQPASHGGFPEQALSGFFGLLHVNALVYVLVSGTVQIVERAWHAREGDGTAANGHLARIAVAGDSGVTIVDTDTIRWIEAAGDYVRLHLPDDSRLLSERMCVLERSLDPERFLRVHRSAIVRLGAVKEVRPLASGDGIAVLDDGMEVRVSRRRRRSLMDRF